MPRRVERGEVQAVNEGGAGDRLDATLDRMVEVVEAQQARIRELEAVEERLREQDPSYLDARVGEENRALFRMLEQLAVAESAVRAGLPTEGEVKEVEGPRATEAGDKIFQWIVKHLMDKHALPMRDPILSPEEVEERNRKQLGAARQGRGLRPR